MVYLLLTLQADYGDPGTEILKKCDLSTIITEVTATSEIGGVLENINGKTKPTCYYIPVKRFDPVPTDFSGSLSSRLKCISNTMRRKIPEKFWPIKII